MSVTEKGFFNAENPEECKIKKVKCQMEDNEKPALRLHFCIFNFAFCILLRPLRLIFGCIQLQTDINRSDKLCIMQFLVFELAKEENALLRADESYPIWSPYNSFEAASALLDALKLSEASRYSSRH
jgi:hypothetical protein